MRKFSDRAERAFSLIEESGMTNLVGDGDPRRVGGVGLTLLETLGGLRPTDTVLDFGCGVGRISVAVADALTTGHLHGVDIVPKMIDLCHSSISSIFPNTQFYCSDAGNICYDHLKSSTGASEHKIFNGLQNKIDLAFAFSVFTHLSPEEAAKSLRLMATTVKNDGTLFITAFVLDGVSRASISRGSTFFNLKGTPSDTDLYFNPDKRQGFSGFDANLLTKMAQDAGLYIAATLNGSWRGVPIARGFTSFQDIIVMRKHPVAPDDFDEARYLERNPDVAAARLRPFFHYLSSGQYEGRAYK